MSDRYPLQGMRKRYDPVGSCIYCGASAVPLTDEHIIPRGIYGGLVLPRASCLDCNSITSARESRYQNGTIKDLRTALEMPNTDGQRISRPIRIRSDKGDEAKHHLQDAPSFIFSPILPLPEVLGGSSWLETAIQFQMVVVNPSSARKLQTQHGNFKSTPISFNVIDFSLMIAKIAHSFATAELSPILAAQAEFVLPDLIRGISTITPDAFVGGAPQSLGERPAELHQIELQKWQVEDRHYIVVRLSLFAFWRTPPFLIVAAKLGAQRG